MSDEVRMQRLSVAMKVVSVFFVSFLLYLLLVFLDSPILAEGTLLADLTRWEPFNPAYEGMIASIYVVWGIFFWRASANPSEHGLLIDFTIWANLAHAAEMLISAFVFEGELIHLVSEVSLLVLISAVLLWLRPRTARAPI